MANFLLEWDKAGEHYYETGVDHGVLFVMDDDGEYGEGVVWNGLTAISESPEGGEPTPLYADNIKYLNLYSKEEFNATIEAYCSPEAFDVCDGKVSIATGVKIGQQTRQAFGFAYRSKIGNDLKADDYGYKLHLVYNAKASPSERSRETINDTPNAEVCSWEVTTTATEFTIDDKEFKAAHIEIDSTKVDATKLAAFEKILYGTPATTDPEAAAVPARLPLPDEVADLLSTASAGGGVG